MTTIASSNNLPMMRRVLGPRIAPVRSNVAWLALLIVLFYVTFGPLISFRPGRFSGDGSPLRQLGYVITLIMTILAIRPLLRPDRLLVLPLSMVLLLGWCWFSISWSIDPAIAIRRLMLTTIFAWIMFALIENVEYGRVLTALRLVMVIMLLANFGAVLIKPEFGIHQAGDDVDASVAGAWRGVMMQKNFAGALCAMTILAFLFDCKHISILVRALVIVAAFFFLVKSESKTSAGIMLFSIGAAMLYLRYNPAYRSFLIPVIVTLAVIGLLYGQTHWDKIVAPLDDPAAFTGRTQIWKTLLSYARMHLLQGSGYGSFWNIGYGTGPIYQYTKGWIVEYAAQGHNGYLDLLVTIGLPGLVLAVLATLILPLAHLLSSMTFPRPRGALLLAMLLFCAGHNLTESSLLDRDTLMNAFLMFTVASIATSRKAIATSVLGIPRRG